MFCTRFVGHKDRITGKQNTIVISINCGARHFYTWSKQLSDTPIWIVEDDEDDVQFYRECLAELLPMTDIVIFNTAEKVLHDMDLQGILLPNLIIIDGRLPLMNGPKLVRTLLIHPIRWKVEMVMIAGTLSASDMEEVKKLGADVHIKPNKISLLFDILQKILRDKLS